MTSDDGDDDGVIGLSLLVHALWWYESADHRAEVRHKAHNDARVVAAGETPPLHPSRRTSCLKRCMTAPTG